MELPQFLNFDRVAVCCGGCVATPRLGHSDRCQSSERCKGRSKSTKSGSLTELWIYQLKCRRTFLEHWIYVARKVQKTLEVTLVQYIDLIVDVTVCGNTGQYDERSCPGSVSRAATGDNVREGEKTIVLPQGCPTQEICPGSTLYGEKVHGQLPGDLSESFHSENLRYRVTRCSRGCNPSLTAVSSVCLVTASRPLTARASCLR